MSDGPGKDHETRQRTAEELQADIEVRRAELTKSVDALVERVHPGKQASRFVNDLKAGEPKAVSVVVGVVSVTVGLIGVVLVRRNRAAEEVRPVMELRRSVRRR